MIDSILTYIGDCGLRFTNYPGVLEIPGYVLPGSWRVLNHKFVIEIVRAYKLSKYCRY